MPGLSHGSVGPAQGRQRTFRSIRLMRARKGEQLEEQEGSFGEQVLLGSRWCSSRAVGIFGIEELRKSGCCDF